MVGNTGPFGLPWPTDGADQERDGADPEEVAVERALGAEDLEMGHRGPLSLQCARSIDVFEGALGRTDASS
jgi:hypothetical protein